MLTTKIPLLGRNLFCLLLFSLLSITVLAQTKVNGKITGPDGKPLSGATVSVNGTSQGTTDNTGSFSVTVKNGDQISISMIGYETATAIFSGQSSLDLELRADVSGLNEVVVTGYGTQRRRNVTGAIASVNSRTLNELPNISVSQALQGRVAGVTVTNNGSPVHSPSCASGVSALSAMRPTRCT